MSFNRDDRRGGGGSFRGPRDDRGFGGGRSFGGGRGGSDRPVEMHKTVCSKCGKECEVPFKPTGAKPVFCRDCFREQGGSDNRRSDGPRNFERRDDRRDDRSRPPQAQNPSIRPQIEEINAKLDKILGMLTSNVSAEVSSKVKVAAPKKPRAPKKVVAAEEVVVFEEPAGGSAESPIEEFSDKTE